MTWQRPSGKSCPKCGNALLIKGQKLVCADEIKQLAEEFEACQKILLALGDENRQHLILEMMKMDECGGVRVGAITENQFVPTGGVSSYSNFEGGRYSENASGRHEALLLL